MSHSVTWLVLSSSAYQLNVVLGAWLTLLVTGIAGDETVKLTAFKPKTLDTYF